MGIEIWEAKDAQETRMLRRLIFAGEIEGNSEVPHIMFRYFPIVAVEILRKNGSYDKALKILEQKAKVIPMSSFTYSSVLYEMVCLLISIGQKEKAMEKLMMYTEISTNMYFKKLVFMLMHDIYIQNDKTEELETWLEQAQKYLQTKLDFSILAAAIRVDTMLHGYSQTEAIDKYIQLIPYEDAAYINTADDFRDIKQLITLLRDQKVDTSSAMRVYIKRNPLTKKEEILKYFTEYPEDTDTLLYVLERRDIKELSDIAQQTGVESEIISVRRKLRDGEIKILAWGETTEDQEEKNTKHSKSG